jgi:hypothetical protein
MAEVLIEVLIEAEEIGREAIEGHGFQYILMLIHMN